MLDWGKKDEFVQAMFRRSHSVHSRRFYEVALRKFGAFCKERRIDADADGVQLLHDEAGGGWQAATVGCTCADRFVQPGP